MSKKPKKKPTVMMRVIGSKADARHYASIVPGLTAYEVLALALEIGLRQLEAIGEAGKC